MLFLWTNPTLLLIYYMFMIKVLNNVLLANDKRNNNVNVASTLKVESSQACNQASRCLHLTQHRTLFSSGKVWCEILFIYSVIEFN